MSTPSNLHNPDFDRPPPGAGTVAAGRPVPASRPLSIRGAMLLVVAAAIALRLGLLAGPVVVVVLLVVAAVAATVGGIAALIRGPSLRSEPMLRVVAHCVGRGLPVEPGVEACGALCGGAVRRRSRAVVRLMERGVPMAEAFGRVRGSLPRSAIVTLRMGWDGPELAEALRGLVRRGAERRPLRASLGSRLAYLAGTLLAMQAITAFMMIWVAPKLQAIAMDFGLPLPAVTRWAFGLGDHPAFGPAVTGLVLLQLVGYPLLALIAFDPLDGGIGPIDRLSLKRHGATVLRALAGEVARGRPMPEALERIGRAYPSGTVRRRIGRARRGIDLGRPWARCLAAAGLIRRRDAAVLEAAERAGNLAWALGELAEGLDRRSGYRALVWSQVLFPVAVIALAVPVALFALVYFLPLITMIRALAE